MTYARAKLHHALDAEQRTASSLASSSLSAEIRAKCMLPSVDADARRELIDRLRR